MSDSATAAARDSYYGRPILKAPVWTWEIPAYFFFGGMAGAAAPFALLSELRGDEALARRAWLVALVGAAASPPLLIADLGRPERFHRMLRVIKPTSPMSLGSWVLGASSTAIAFANVRTHLGCFPRLGRLAGATAVLGPALSTYTDVLMADTAIPVWHEARGELPFVFAAGAAMSAGSAMGSSAAAAPHAGSRSWARPASWLRRPPCCAAWVGSASPTARAPPAAPPEPPGR